ncbi:hypothetical protein QYE76_023906 [Lolium multiflorum]|uniref:Uncharacterized protein n=1 Tax=Lolium multiflorum TaxID=4521 RepID=A0AAD8RFE6_LOLMU|nr:hypothetical protein QYE76_023906 [Lolium multiflorum]
MSRPHQLWMYVGKDDKSRVSSADLSGDELRDEVHRLTCFSMKDNIVLTLARPPYDLKHLPAEASTVAQCYPPTPESGVELEDDDDDSEETEDAQHALEDSDVQGDEAPEDDVLTRSRRSDDDDELPLAKRAWLLSGKAESAKESNPSPADPTPPSRTTVVKIPVSKQIYATVDAVADFADQFTRLESENVQLRKTIKISADQVLEANKLTADAQNENILLKDELKKLKQKMKDEHDARREAAVTADKKEGALRESITNLLSAADVPINRAHKLQEDSMSDTLSLATDANIQVLGASPLDRGSNLDRLELRISLTPPSSSSPLAERPSSSSSSSRSVPASSLPASSPITGNLLRIRGDRSDLPRLPCTASVSVEFVHDDSSHGRSSPRRARRFITAELVYSVHVAIDGVPSAPAIYHPAGMQLHKRLGDPRSSLLEHHVFIAIPEPPTVSTDRIRSLPPPPSRSSTYGVRSSRKA